MRVSELIEKLKQQPQDAKVIMLDNYTCDYVNHDSLTFDGEVEEFVYLD